MARPSAPLVDAGRRLRDRLDTSRSCGGSVTVPSGWMSNASRYSPLVLLTKSVFSSRLSMIAVRPLDAFRNPASPGRRAARSTRRASTAAAARPGAAFGPGSVKYDAAFLVDDEIVGPAERLALEAVGERPLRCPSASARRSSSARPSSAPRSAGPSRRMRGRSIRSCSRDRSRCCCPCRSS